jgi:hypothetical protein
MAAEANKGFYRCPGSQGFSRSAGRDDAICGIRYWRPRARQSGSFGTAATERRPFDRGPGSRGELVQMISVEWSRVIVHPRERPLSGFVVGQTGETGGRSHGGRSFSCLRPSGRRRREQIPSLTLALKINMPTTTEQELRGIAARLHLDPRRRNQLLALADGFERSAERIESNAAAEARSD